MIRTLVFSVSQNFLRQQPKLKLSLLLNNLELLIFPSKCHCRVTLGEENLWTVYASKLHKGKGMLSFSVAPKLISFAGTKLFCVHVHLCMLTVAANFNATMFLHEDVK